MPQNVDALNAGFAGQLLEQYLENPASVPEEWRLLFESDGAELVRLQPGLERLLERRANGAPAAPPAPAEPALKVVEEPETDPRCPWGSKRLRRGRPRHPFGPTRRVPSAPRVARAYAHRR